jgi:SAM-dependent methyltransferase
MIDRDLIALASAAIFIALLSLFISCSGQGGRWSSEWEERYEEWQPSEYVMDTFGVKPGMNVAEIGAGNGRFAVRLADRVGEGGRVYANDIDPEALRFMRKRIREEQIENMIVIEGKLTDPRLPRGELDLVCIVNTYDDLSRPVELMRNILPALKPAGLLVIMVYDPEKVGDLKGHAVPRETVIHQAEAAGFTLVNLDDSLSKDTIYIFRPASRYSTDRLPPSTDRSLR